MFLFLGLCLQCLFIKDDLSNHNLHTVTREHILGEVVLIHDTNKKINERERGCGNTKDICGYL